MSYASTFGGSIRPSFADFRTGSVRFLGEQPGAVLMFDQQAQNWRGVLLGAGQVPFANIPPAVNDSIVYDGNQWVPGTNRLSQLADVDITNLVVNQTLRWTGNRWINYTAPTPSYGTVQQITAGGGLLGGVITQSGTISLPSIALTETPNGTTNVTLTGVTCDNYGRVANVTTVPYKWPAASANAQAGNVLVRDTGTSPCNLSFLVPNLGSGFLKDVQISGPAAKQTLRHNGTNWGNAQLNTGDLSDVSAASAVSGNLLKFNGTQWINSAIGLGTNLSDVTLTSPTPGNVLKFNGLSWENSTISTSDITNFLISSPVSGNVLKYNGAVWANYILTSSDLTDFNIASPVTNNLLKYNGTKWVNSTISLGANLTDVALSALAPDNLLKYNNATGKWVNSTISTNDITNFALSGLAPDNLLKYNNATGKWVNSTISTSDITNFNISAPTTENLLKYNGTRWVNSTIALGTNLSDVVLTSPALNNFLRYNGTQWVNTSVALNTNVSDVVISAPASGNFLRYNSSTSKWNNNTASLPDMSDIVFSTRNPLDILTWNSATNRFNNAPFTVSHVETVSYFSHGPTALSTFRVNNTSGSPESGINLIGGLSVDTPDNTAGVLWPLNNNGPQPAWGSNLATSGGIFDMTTLGLARYAGTLRIRAFCTFTQRTVTGKPAIKGMLYVKFTTGTGNLASGNNQIHRIGTVPSESSNCIITGDTVTIPSDNMNATCHLDVTVKNPGLSGATHFAIFGYFESSATGNRSANFGAAVDGNNAMFRLGNMAFQNAGSAIFARPYNGQQIAGTNGDSNYPCGIEITLTQ